MMDIFPAERQIPEREEMSESEVLKAIDQEIRWATDLLQDDLSSNRTKAWEYFKGTAPKTLDKDVSEFFQDIVSRDVADAVEATLAEILPAFATDRPATFDPIAPGDEDQAALESDLCNEILMEENGGYLEFLTAAKNALLLRIGAIEVMAEEYEEVEYREATLDSQTLAMVSMDPNIDIREMAHPNVVDLQSGLAIDQIQVQLRIRQKQRRIRTQAVPTDELLISSDSESVNLDEARFVGRQTLVSRSELISKGYDRSIVENLTAYTTTTSQRSRSARERNTWGREKHAGDRGTDLVQTVRCYYKLDEDRDGIAERREIIVAGTPGGWRLLSDEPIDYQPFASGVAYVWQHQPFGISLFDKLKHVQDLKTKFWRILLEAGQRASRDRAGLLPGTDLDDWMNSQFGGGVRMSSPQGVVTIPNPRFPAELGTLQEIADKARREGGGGAVDKSNRELMPVEAGAHGLERMLSAIEELNSFIARTLAESLVKPAYLILHHTLRTFGRPIMRQVNGQWQMVDPSTWQPRTQISLSTGLTMAERNRQAAALNGIIERQEKMIASGSTLANDRTLYRAIQDQARMLGVAHPQSYFLDPDSQEGQEARQRKAQQQQQAMQVQAQQAEQAANLQGQTLAMVEQVRGQMRIAAEREKTQAQLAESLASLREDQRQFQENLALQYDELRVKLVEIESKYGETPEEPIRNE